MAGKPPDEEELAGTWWDGADEDVRKILRKLRAIEDRQVEFKTLLEDLLEVRKSKTRTRQLDTSVAEKMRQAMLDAGIPHTDVDRAIELFLTATRPLVERDTVRLAVKRLGSSALPPSGKSKRSPDKSSK